MFACGCMWSGRCSSNLDDMLVAMVNLAGDSAEMVTHIWFCVPRWRNCREISPLSPLPTHLSGVLRSGCVKSWARFPIDVGLWLPVQRWFYLSVAVSCCSLLPLSCWCGFFSCCIIGVGLLVLPLWFYMFLAVELLFVLYFISFSINIYIGFLLRNAVGVTANE